MEGSAIDALVDIGVNRLLVVAFKKFHGQGDTLRTLLVQRLEEAEFEGLNLWVIVFFTHKDDLDVSHVRHEHAEIERLQRAHVGQDAM